MRNELEVFGVQVGSVSLQSSYITSVALSFEVILLSSSVQQSTPITDFNNYFSFTFFTFAGYQVRDGNRGSIGITSSCK